MTLQKSAVFGDIHFGKKANSQQHNDDCLRFIDWFIEQVQQEPDIDNIIFLGDWHENRSALNIATLDASYEGAKKLNDLQIPIYFLVGNHDLYHRHTRDIHSVRHLSEFDYITVYDQIAFVEELGPKGTLLVPYIFHDEYPQLTNYLHVPFWAGHFEFQGFEIAKNMVLPSGPRPEDFKGPKYIVSGHFHKRQVGSNVIYIGNTFPMDFNDADDPHRGMMFYDHQNDQMWFRDWPDCPMYTKTKLTDIIDDNTHLYPNSRVKCIVDVPISFEESTTIRQQVIENYNLREFTLEESHEWKQALSETNTDVEWADDEKPASVDEVVIQMLNEIETDQLNNQTLTTIYNNLKTD